MLARADTSELDTRTITDARAITRSREQTAAERCVAQYLATFGLGPGPRRARMAHDLVTRARERAPRCGASALRRLALAESDAALERWFRFVLGDASVVGQRPLLQGRLAWQAAGGPPRWAQWFLAADRPPTALVQAMRAAIQPPTPPEQPISMTEQSLETWSLRDLAGVLQGTEREAALGATGPAAP